MGAAVCAATVVIALSTDTAGSDAQGPLEPVANLGDRFVPKPPGTVEHLKFFYGPYAVPPGNDMNRFDVDLPLRNGFVEGIRASLVRASDLSRIPHGEAHIHHAHWLQLDPGNKEDVYTGGLTAWRWGTGSEETAADSRPQTNADPHGPVYGGYLGAGSPQLMVYMIHNETPQPMAVYIVLDIIFEHGTMQQLNAPGVRPHHSLTGVVFGRTFDVPRNRHGPGTFKSVRDDKRGPIEWTSTIDGTIIGTAGHLHQGGIEVAVSNLGRRGHPCPATRRGLGGTLLFRSQAVYRKVPWSDDLQMTVSRGAWRAPIHKGDRLRVSGTYENRDHAWYYAMAYEGFYIDPKQPPRRGCSPYLLGARTRAAPHPRAHRRGAPDPTVGVLSRPWDGSPEPVCGTRYGAPPCDRPEPNRGRGVQTSVVTIANFVNMPGDRGLAGTLGAPVRVRHGTSLTFINADATADIRHTVTTCRWPCNGPDTANYPLPDGVWDSDTLGHDTIDGGKAVPIASTPKDLPVGRYAYFCRIHPWMRGAFEVVP